MSNTDTHNSYLKVNLDKIDKLTSPCHNIELCNVVYIIAYCMSNIL